MTYRIQRIVDKDAVVFVLSGELDADQAAALRDLLGAEDASRVRLDLKETTRVDRSGLEFLAQVDLAGITLVNCTNYVRRWMTEKDKGQ